EEHRHRDHARQDELLEVDAAGGAPANQRLDAGTENEQEQDRLREAGHYAGGRAAEANDLAPPHHADGAQVPHERALGRGRGRVTDVGDGGAGQRLGGSGFRRRHQPRLQPRTIGLALNWSTPPASASRISRPVYRMNTSSRLGRRTLTLRTPTVRCSNIRGTKASPSGTRIRNPSPSGSTSPSTPSP